MSYNIEKSLIPSLNKCAKLSSLLIEKALHSSHTDLTLKQFIILSKLSSEDRNQTDLALITNRDKGCLTRLIQSLESKNYVERYIKEEDKRVNFVKITPTGIIALDAAKPIVFQTFENITDGLDSKEEQILKQAISKLTTNANNLLSKAKTNS